MDQKTRWEHTEKVIAQAKRTERQIESAKEDLARAAAEAVDAGITVADVARLLGVTRATVYAWRDKHQTSTSD